MATQGRTRTAAECTLSESDWDVLVAVPFAVFFLVAYADGRLSPAERRAFAGIVDAIGARARSTDDALVREVMGRISRDPGQILERLDGQVGTGLPFHQVLSTGRTLLDGMADDAAAWAFKVRMLQMAEAIAEAWPRFGRRTTLEEQRSIDFVRDVLGVAGGATTASPAAPRRNTRPRLR